MENGDSRMPDLRLGTKKETQIWICDMKCPMQRNIDAKRRDKLTRYRQLAIETRERRPGYTVMTAPVIHRWWYKENNE